MAPNYLVKRQSGIYHFRFSVPEKLRAAIGKRELTKSLGTREPRRARYLAGQYIAALETVFDSAKAGYTSTMDKDAVLRQLGIDPDSVGELVNVSYHPVHGANVSVDSGGKLTTEQEAEIARSLLDHAAEKGFSTPAAPVEPMGETQQTAPPGELLSIIAKRFIESKKAAWTEKTERTYVSMFETVVSLLKDPHINTVTSKNVSAISVVLTRYPSRASDYPELRELSAWDRAAKQVIATVKKEPYPVISAQTVNTHLERLSALFDYAILHGEAVKNPAKGICVAVQKNVVTRRAFSNDELKTLFEAPFYRQHQYKKPYEYWLPHFGLLTGARINELAGLALDDVGQDEGVWSINIKPRPKIKGEPPAREKDGHRVKNKASIRRIPLHPMLIELGFLEYVESIRKAGHWRVFPELPKGRDGYAKNATRWFLDYRKSCDVGDDAVDFHAFRHTFEGVALRARINAEYRSVWLGHSVGRGAMIDGGAAMTVEAYKADYPAKLLLEEVALKIDFGLDLTPYEPVLTQNK